ncbi:hypothetical protein, partial [Stenotrophomonas maltophilia]|uniref:hypothetical protein n=1 Tax=Stenotrophomonas maltophilia TaxID=40324 RepID=UPI001954F807
ADPARDRVTFRTRKAGILEVRRDMAAGGYAMALPAYPPAPAEIPGLLAALGVGLADFLSPEGAADAAPAVTVIPAHSIPVIKSPDGKCELKILGPVDLAARFEWYELAIQP